MKINRVMILISIVVILLFSTSLVSASSGDGDELALSNDTDVISQQIGELEEMELSSPSNISSGELKSIDGPDRFIVGDGNFKRYFDENNVLKKEYGGSIIDFNGNFNDKGIITISSPNTKITGSHALFNNTVFSLNAEGVMLTNIHLVLDKEFPENDNAGILIKSDNITVYNCSIDYDVPLEKTGFAIFSNGEDWGNEVVNIINNTINYVGRSYGSGFNYGMLLTETFNATVSGNTLNCSLPMRSVDWSSEIYGGSSMDFVAALVADTCRYLRLSDNKIYADVNGVRCGEPTLDTVMIYYCNDAIIENNIIRETDYVTEKGNANYLYGLDMYLSSNVMVYGNDINIFTNGGKEAHGTAYPIQITGPASNVSISFNNIKSYSNGPNIGIYSQNFYGETALSIISNIINVTGFASDHSWALVAGIEAQDSNDIILNNTIYVNSVNEFKQGYNLYGISYSQQTRGAHSYNIQYNKVKTSGDWAVALMGGSSSPVVNSIIANNILNARKHGGNRAALISGGFGAVLNNTDGSKHVKKSMSVNDYPQFLKNYLNSSNANDIDFSWISNGKSLENSKRHHSGLGDGINQGRSNLNVVRDGNGVNRIYTKSDVRNGNVNSTYYVPGDSGLSLAGASAASGHSRSSQLKSYEIKEAIKNQDESTNSIQLILLIFTLSLLLIGYKREESTEDN